MRIPRARGANHFQLRRSSTVAWVIALVLPLLGVSAFVEASQSRPVATRSLADDMDRIPSLATARERVDALVSVHRALPSLFREPVAFDRDPSEILEKQSALWSELIRQPEFASLRRQRRGLVDIIIENRSEAIRASLAVDPTSLSAWRDGLAGALKGLPRERYGAGDADGDRLLLKGISDGLADRTVGHSQTLISALIDLLPTERRHAASKMTYRDLLGLFRTELPGDLVEAGLRPQALGWSESTLSPTEALRRLEAARQAEMHLGRLIQIRLLLQNQDGTVSGSLDDLIERARSVDETALNALNRPAAFGREASLLRSVFARVQPNLGSALQSALVLVAQQFRELASDTVVLRNKAGASLVLREASPLMAAFRGFAAKDRATETAFSMAQSPLDRVFFIFDSASQIKGTLVLTRVRVGHEAGLYVQSINGANITSSEAEEIIRSLHLLRSELGASFILLPERDDVVAAVDSLEIRAAFERTASRQAVTIGHEDESIRSILRKYGTGTATPAMGRLLAAGDGESRLASVRPSSLPVPELRLADRKELILLLLDLMHSRRSHGQAWNEVIRAAGVDAAQIRRAYAVFQNEIESPVSHYVRAVRESMSELGVDVVEEPLDDFLIRHWWLWLDGRLRAPDAFSAENDAQTRQYLTLALASGSTPAIERILDAAGERVMSQPSWRTRFASSDGLSALLAARLHLLHVPGFDTVSKTAIEERIRRFSPNLLDFYGLLRSSRTTAEFLQRVPPGIQTKADFVLQAVKSSLNHFLSMNPQPDEIRRLAQWMHDYDLILHITSKSLERARTAGEFAKIADFVYPYPIASYRERLQQLIRSRLNDFFRLNPGIDVANLLRSRVPMTDADLGILRTMAPRATTSSEYMQLVRVHVERHAAERSHPYFVGLRAFLNGEVTRFASLEPTADEVNEFRRQLLSPHADLQLLEYVLPKQARSSDVLKLLTFYGTDRNANPSEYQGRLRELMVRNVDLFLASRPNVAEINRYRNRAFDLAIEPALLRAALERATTPAEILATARLFGDRPRPQPEPYDRLIMNLLVENVRRFLAMNPTIEDVGAFRTRMANAEADLLLVDYALGKSARVDEFLSVLAVRPRSNTPSFVASWDRVVARHFARFASLEPDETQAHAYLLSVTDVTMNRRMREYLNARRQGSLQRIGDAVLAIVGVANDPQMPVFAEPQLEHIARPAQGARQ